MITDIEVALDVLLKAGIVQIAEHSFLYNEALVPTPFLDSRKRDSARSIGEFAHAQGWTRCETRVTWTASVMVTRMLIIDARRLKTALEKIECSSTQANARNAAANSSADTAAGASVTLEAGNSRRASATKSLNDEGPAKPSKPSPPTTESASVGSPG